MWVVDHVELPRPGRADNLFEICANLSSSQTYLYLIYFCLFYGTISYLQFFCLYFCVKKYGIPKWLFFYNLWNAFWTIISCYNPTIIVMYKKPLLKRNLLHSGPYQLSWVCTTRQFCIYTLNRRENISSTSSLHAAPDTREHPLSIHYHIVSKTRSGFRYTDWQLN